jgi:hypothetical protein
MKQPHAQTDVSIDIAIVSVCRFAVRKCLG